MTMSNKTLKVAALALTAILAAACDETRSGESVDEKEEVVEAPPGSRTDNSQAVAPVEAPAAETAMLELERVLRRVERGTASDADGVVLEKVIVSSALPAEALDRASLGLSRAREAAGDGEGAIAAVETLMKRHAGDTTFELHDASRRRLRLLVSGTEEAPTRYDQNMEPMASVGKALVPYFPEDDRGATLADIVLVGKAPNSADPHGIFNLRAAKRDLEESACSVCDIDIRVQRSISRIDSWVDLALQAGERRADMPNPDRSMVVVYFDLEQNRVPSRYDAYLAVPSEETIERLERGEAFVAVRERPGKKPLLLLAAPRAGQLDHVETAFAEMTTLPMAPVVVEVPKKLLPAEIQGVVRGGFKGFRTCYEKILAVDPKAAGKVTAKFRIMPNGAVEAVSSDSTFEGSDIGNCIADRVAKMRFPAGGVKTEVTYPIAFSP